jgi:large subunit ribosomal protein L18
MKRKIHNEKLRRRLARGTRNSLSVRLSERPRLVVFRSAKHIYAQIVDAESGKTLGTVSSRSKAVVGEGYPGNVEAAKKVGTAVAALAKEKQIDTVVFNRNGFLFHGRVKALAEAAREAGLNF